jgi:hypothetical protein
MEDENEDEITGFVENFLVLAEQLTGYERKLLTSSATRNGQNRQRLRRDKVPNKVR